MREERKSIIVMNMSGWTVIFPRNINISAEADIYPKISFKTSLHQKTSLFPDAVFWWRL